jgi:putative membrane protein
VEAPTGDDCAGRATSAGEGPAERTGLAEDRTLLASERTFASWIRTGLAAIGVALGLSALFRPMHPTWAAKTIAALFLAVAIFMFLTAERRAFRIRRHLHAHEIDSIQQWRLRIIAYALIGASAAVALGLWLLV